MMAQKDPVAAAAQRYKPIQSAVPGTTLGPIQINAFLGGGVYAFSFVFFPSQGFLFVQISVYSLEEFCFLSVLLLSCSSKS